ncbi:ABC transporter permease [Streptomyces sp. NBC_00249]|uniref:ABC transporter permease n=1 Tax=Streptomyces sp. NBC_00249 TaxID=2975690 RepID=UPI00224DA4D4|nr:ABC transporter permease [Streptomyces sp. NBC_00249]MCX5195301.1 ABC transporter permease [Streptomyces sp. NBC_00249]
MNTLTRDVPGQGTAPARTRRLRGLAWLLVNQHRTALVVCAAAAVLGSITLVYQRAAMLDTLHGAGWPQGAVDTQGGNLANRIQNDLNSWGTNLSSLPLLLGVFLGAPLVSSGQQDGTVRLVTTQSVPRGRWLRWQVGFALVLAVVTVLPLSLLYGWWWRSVGPFAPDNWLSGSLFEASGPVPAAEALFMTALGITVGALLRRPVAAMAVTLATSYVVAFAVDVYKDRLATPHRVTFPLDGAQPAFLEHAVEADRWIGTASGKLYGWGTCVSDSSPEACRASLGIVNSVWDYFGKEQMAGMQWTAAGLYLALGAALVGVLVWRSRRGPL